MTQALEHAVSRLAFAARAMERALHSPGPWVMEWGAIRVPAERVITERGIVFRAEFPEHCWITPPDPAVTLLCADQPVSVREIDFPGDGAFGVEWTLTPANALMPA